jgi:hypothetical protein
MITIQQTVDIPANRRLIVDIPLDVPTGKTSVVLIFSQVERSEAADMDTINRNAERLNSETLDVLSHTFPTIEEIKAEAARKGAKRAAAIKATGIDPLQKYCGCLKDVFDEDGVVIQRRMRDEWPE